MLLRVPELPDELLRLLLPDTLLLPDELLRLLLLDTLLLPDELLRLLLLDTLLLPDELLMPTDTLTFFDEPLEARELEDEAEVLREVLDELVRRAVPPVLLLRVEALTLPEVLLRRVAVDVAGRSAAEASRLPGVFFTFSVRLEPARTGVLEVTAVRWFSSESTFTIRLFSSREGTFTNPFLRSLRLFS